jgi:hypothetical protein
VTVVVMIMAVMMGGCAFLHLIHPSTLESQCS